MGLDFFKKKGLIVEVVFDILVPRHEGCVANGTRHVIIALFIIIHSGNVLRRIFSIYISPLIDMATTSLDLLYSQIDVFPTFSPPPPVLEKPINAEHSPQLYSLLSELVSVQDRQTALLEELVTTIAHTQRRRIVELGMWKLSHPELAEYCKRAARKLERIQADQLSSITEEIETNSDVLFDSEFGLNEFIDRFGTRFLQLNSLLQVLTQLGNAPDLQIAPHEIQNDN